MSTTERDYVLGTNDEEIQRLALQHRVWRPRALDAWRRAGFTTGQTLLDVGCGPGHATVDLAGIVGPHGRIVAIDRSRRFLDFLTARRERENFPAIEVHERDLETDALPPANAHGAWVRWVFSFLSHRRELLGRIHDALRPGGVLVAHEYLQYDTWRYIPRAPEIEAFVKKVEASWKKDGGQPDVGLELPAWLAEDGFEIRSLEPVQFVVGPENFVWQWARAFLATGPRRLVALGQLTEAECVAIEHAHAALEANPHARVVTPAVLEIVAIRR